MNINELIALIKAQKENIEFDLVIETIDQHYFYTPGRFTNGDGDNPVINETGTNEGSCKIFSFAKLNGLNQQETLACFGTYYRDDVLKNPDSHDHGNIRAFMAHGWNGIYFDTRILEEK